MKYSYIIIVAAFFVSFILSYQMINITKSVKAQNRLAGLKVNLSDFDTDKNNDITDEEITIFFTEAFKKQGNGTLEPWSYETVITPIISEKKRKVTEDAFRKIDTDSDNTITSEEYAAHNAGQIKAFIKKLKQMKTKAKMKQPSKPMPLKPIQFKQAPKNDKK